MELPLLKILIESITTMKRIFQRCFHYFSTLDVNVVNDDLRNHEID